MYHPTTRAERRYNRDVRRNRRRTIIYTSWSHSWDQKTRLEQAESNSYWNDCGNITIGCRNRRCSVCLYDKLEKRRKNRRDRYKPIDSTEE